MAQKINDIVSIVKSKEEESVNMTSDFFCFVATVEDYKLYQMFTPPMKK
ncbi:MAG: hypothetical protein ACJA1A_002644 [Saprospiraceae bacterium]|jgi:hypothetical protein